MGFKRSTTDIKVHQSLGDTPNVDNGITAEDLKKKYDYPAETIQNDLNGLMKELEETTGASNIGAEPLEDGDTSGNTIKDKLIKIFAFCNSLKQGELSDSSIITNKIQDSAVTEAKIQDNAVTNRKIQDGVITTSKIENGAVIGEKIANGTITGEKVHEDVKKAVNITATQINNNDTSDANVQAKLNKIYQDLISITQGAVADNSITTAKIQDSAVTADKISDTSINNSKIKDNSITANKIAEGYGLVPSGFIGMWSGSVIPAGWLLCDGTNGTPDLRNRFIVGAGDEYAVGDTGGEKEHTLTVDEMPSHTHILDWWKSASSNGYKTTKNFLYAGSNSATGLLNNNRSKASAASTGTITADISYVGGSEAHENRPPYYALAYIMKA